jgi:ferric-dicitrate binding protein FerR (iron transport regulator)
MEQNSEAGLTRIIYLFEQLHQLSITREEYQELKSWARASPANARILNDFFDEQKSRADVAQWNAFDSDAAFERLNRKFRRKSVVRYTAIAASLLLVAATGLFFIAESNDWWDGQKMAQVNDIQPGRNKAVLKFSGDKTIALNEAQNGIQINDKGVAYQNGELIDQRQGAVTRQVTLSVPKGGKYEIKLDDGTHIWVNAFTELKFPERFKGSKYREVELSGEAYFEVAHDAARPFRVKMQEETVEVLGTSFNLSNYAADDFNKTTLLTGKVGIDIPKTKGGNERTVLLPGQQAVYDKQLKQLHVADIDAKNAISWKNGDFMFDNEDISSIVKQLERWYDIKVTYQHNFKGFYFSGIVSRSQPLSAVLDMLVSTGKIKYSINKERKEVILSRE